MAIFNVWSWPFFNNDLLQNMGNKLQLVTFILFIMCVNHLLGQGCVAIHRERPQSITDIQTEELSGSPRNGDAAFADYVINFGISYRISSKTKIAPELLDDFKSNTSIIN